MPATKKIRFEIAVSPNSPLPPLEGANWFHFSSIGSEVQLLVGSINLLDMMRAQSSTDTTPVVMVPEVSHRFLLSPVGFEMLKQQVNEIAEGVKDSGLNLGHVGK